MAQNQIRNLWPLEKFLRVFNAVGGYPITTDFSTREVTLVSRLEYLKLLALLTVQLLPMTVLVTMLEWQFGRVDISYLVDKVCMNSLDFWMHNLITGLSVSASVSTFTVFVRNRLGIRDLYRNTAAVFRRLGPVSADKEGLAERSRRQRRWSFRILSAFLVISLLMSGMMTLVTWSTFGELFKDAPRSIVWITSFVTLVSTWSSFSPLLGAAAVTFANHVWAYSHVAHTWQQNLDELGRNAEELEDQETLNRKMDCCFLLADEICSLRRRLNDVLSPLLTILYAAISVFTVITLYGAFGVFFIPWGPKEAVFAASNLLLAILFISSLFISSHTGEKLRQQGTLAVRALEELGIRVFPLLDPERRLGLQMALARLDAGLSVTPFDFFDISNRSMLAIVSLLATYLIVLLQFRVGDEEEAVIPEGINATVGNTSRHVRECG